jgi:hypothetical protein
VSAIADNTENLTLQLLRNLRAEVADSFRNVHARIDNLTTEARIANPYVAALMQREVHTARCIAELDARLSRVERRLELRDE